MDLINAVVHYLDKKPGEQDCRLHLSSAPLAAGKELDLLSAQLLQNYNQRADKKYGVFADTDRDFQTVLESLLEGDAATGLLQVSETLANMAKAALEASEMAAGAYLLLLHFKQGASQFLFVCILQQSQAVGVDDALHLVSQFILDPGQLIMGVKINLQEWQNNASSAYYITTYQSRTIPKITQTLVAQIGFDQTVDAKEDTQALMKAVDQYVSTVECDEEEKREMKRKTIDYCNDVSKEGDTLLLKNLAEDVFDGDPDAFFDFASDKRFNVNEEVVPDRKVLREIQRVSGADRMISVSFAAELFEERVFYDEEHDTLTIKGIPKSLRKRLLSSR